jgi:uncharacterized protein YtpQ (UPF0354 family)
MTHYTPHQFTATEQRDARLANLRLEFARVGVTMSIDRDQNTVTLSMENSPHVVAYELDSAVLLSDLVHTLRDAMTLYQVSG